MIVIILNEQNKNMIPAEIEELIKTIEDCQQVILSKQSVIEDRINKINQEKQFYLKTLLKNTYLETIDALGGSLIAATIPPIELYHHQILQLKGACEFIGYETNFNIKTNVQVKPSVYHNTIKVLLYWISRGECGLTISGHIPYIIQEMLDGKYYSKPSGKPGGTLIKSKSFTNNGINALFEWLAKQEIKWKYMGLDTIFNSKKYNKRNVAHLKLGLDAVMGYSDIPRFNDAVLGNTNTQSPALTDMVLSKSSLKTINVRGE